MVTFNIPSFELKKTRINNFLNIHRMKNEKINSQGKMSDYNLFDIIYVLNSRHSKSNHFCAFARDLDIWKMLE